MVRAPQRQVPRPLRQAQARGGGGQEGARGEGGQGNLSLLYHNLSHLDPLVPYPKSLS